MGILDGIYIPLCSHRSLMQYVADRGGDRRYAIDIGKSTTILDGAHSNPGSGL
jgi:dTDP-D-glucose 4,6-dehydratase